MCAKKQREAYQIQTRIEPIAIIQTDTSKYTIFGRTVLRHCGFVFIEVGIVILYRYVEYVYIKYLGFV